jgi:hypothetical protein
LVIPLQILKQVSWGDEIQPNAKVTFELMDDEGFCRILPGGEYERAMASARSDGADPLVMDAINQVLIPHDFNKETRLESIPSRVLLHLLERRPVPAEVYVRLKKDWIEVWSQDMAQRSLRNSRVIAAKHLRDWHS